MDLNDRHSLEQALETLGEVLEARGLSYTLLVIGGGSLMLLGLLSRPTKDLDVVGLADAGGYRKGRPLPADLTTAVADTARSVRLAEDWINAGPADLLDFGLPAGFEQRVERRRYGGLELHVLGRLDQIATKLYAATDSGPQSKHADDLRQLEPTPDELLGAARWALTHDSSEPFRGELLRALRAFGAEVSDDDL